MTNLEVIHALDPHIFERARRLEAAIVMLRSGQTLRHVRRMLRDRFGLGAVQAWRIAEMANDLAGDVDG